MATGVRVTAVLIVCALVSSAARAEGPADLRSAFASAFAGVEACAALRDVAPGAETATSDGLECARRLPPCATLEIPATVIALDRGVVPDANAPLKRNPAIEGDPPDGVSLRDAFRGSVPWVSEEVVRRVSPDAFAKALGAMRYGDAETGAAPIPPGRDDGGPALTLSAVEQVEFLARLKRGELPTTAESQARTVEIVPAERIGDASFAVKSGSCQGAAWVVGWVDRGPRSTIFAVVETGAGDRSVEDAVSRTRTLMTNLSLVAPPAP
ncbi:MAG TPA: hypothetical protein VGC51_00245 [Hansschlegelia sp.]